MAQCHVCGRKLGMFAKKCRMCGKFACYENKHLIQNKGDLCVVCDEKVNGPKKKGGCFITTAVVGQLNLFDDCEYLTNMRRLRDTYMVSHPIRNQYVEYYYELAPTIVNIIENRTDKQEIYNKMLYDFIIPTSNMVENGEMEQAMQKYLDLIRYAKQIVFADN